MTSDDRLPDPDAGAPYRIRVERRGRKWEAWVESKGLMSFEGWGLRRHRARTRDEAVAKAKRECDEMEAAERRVPDVVEYRPGDPALPDPDRDMIHYLG